MLLRVQRVRIEPDASRVLEGRGTRKMVQMQVTKRALDA